MRFMVVGTGFGETHLRWLLDCPGIDVDHLGYASDRTRAEALARASGIAEVTQDPLSVITRRGVDAVSVVTPPGSHEEIAVAAAEAGMVVFSDKPLANTVAAARRMTDAAGDRGFVAFQWRCHAAFVAMRELCLTGELGDVLDLDLQFHHDFLGGPMTGSPWRHDATCAGAGSLGDQGVHLFDLVRMLVPGSWEVVAAASSVAWPQRTTADDRVVDARTDDIARVQLAVDSEPTRYARVLTSRVSAGHRQIRCTIIGTEGTAIAELDPDDGSGCLRSRTRTHPEWRVSVYPRGLPNPYRAWLDNKGGAAPATFSDGLAAQQLMADAVDIVTQVRLGLSPRGLAPTS